MDRQILAIAKVANCERLLTDDGGLANRARLCDIEPIGLADLAIPDSARQGELQLEEHEELPPAEPIDDASEQDAE